MQKKKKKKNPKQTSDLEDKDTRSHSIRIAKRKENKTKEIRRGFMRGSSSSGSRRSSSGQAAQLLDFSQHPQRAPTRHQHAQEEGQLCIEDSKGGPQEEIREVVI